MKVIHTHILYKYQFLTFFHPPRYKSNKQSYLNILSKKVDIKSYSSHIAPIPNDTAQLIGQVYLPINRPRPYPGELV